MTNETLKLVWDGKIATIQLNDLPTRNAITIDMVTAFGRETLYSGPAC